MIGPQVEKNAAVDFVFMEPTFPRSVRFCIREIREELEPAGEQRRPLRVDRACAAQAARLRGGRNHGSGHELHAYIDELQLMIKCLHQAISETWFLSGPDETLCL
jgi:uncharacterized alpha-E superfamily protein